MRVELASKQKIRSVNEPTLLERTPGWLMDIRSHGRLIDLLLGRFKENTIFMLFSGSLKMLKVNRICSLKFFMTATFCNFFRFYWNLSKFCLVGSVAAQNFFVNFLL